MQSKPGESRDTQGIVERNGKLPDSNLARRAPSEVLKVTVALLIPFFSSSITYAISLLVLFPIFFFFSPLNAHF